MEQASRLDRALQLAILRRLEPIYPFRYWLDEQEFAVDRETFLCNAAYLEGHGLIESGWEIEDMGYRHVRDAQISAAGLDFLADDGGLTAILGAVTVRLHADTIRALLNAEIQASSLPATEKKTLSDHVSRLPETALQEATKSLVATGIRHLPDAIEWLRTLVGL